MTTTYRIIGINRPSINEIIYITKFEDAEVDYIEEKQFSLNISDIQSKTPVELRDMVVSAMDAEVVKIDSYNSVYKKFQNYIATQ